MKDASVFVFSFSALFKKARSWKFTVIPRTTHIISLQC